MADVAWSKGNTHEARFWEKHSISFWFWHPWEFWFARKEPSIYIYFGPLRMVITRLVKAKEKK